MRRQMCSRVSRPVLESSFSAATPDCCKADTWSAIRAIRGEWWASQARISSAEKRLYAAFKGLVTLIFSIPTQETPTKSDATVPKNVSEATELRPAARALIEILHHKPKHYGINRSNWSHASLADAFG